MRRDHLTKVVFSTDYLNNTVLYFYHINILLVTIHRFALYNSSSNFSGSVLLIPGKISCYLSQFKDFACVHGL